MKLTHTLLFSLLLAPFTLLHGKIPDNLLRENLVPWCIVPFDAKKRGPVERAKMLVRLGLKRSAYDWRAQHVSEFEEEILQYKKQGIEFFAFWGGHEKAFELFQKHNIHPQTWKTLPSPKSGTQEEKIISAKDSMIKLARCTAEIGCKLGLYNHGGWGGEPANMVAVCKALRTEGHTHVGIVYNWHHGHGRIKQWKEDLELMKPYLHCLNLNGMNQGGNTKILELGKGEHEKAMLKTLIQSGYDGPVGILDHQNNLDAEESLLANIRGLERLKQEIFTRKQEKPIDQISGSDQVSEVIRSFRGRGTLADDTPPTPAKKAVGEFKVRDGFAIDLMAAEPEVRQPLFMSWDSRGRLWVSQYLQYQFPAGLKIVEYDNHLRARFDSVPKPPPHGAKGADKITVYEDVDGDGFFDRSKDVISGLNVSTSVVTGHGGIWVANPPYLLFYPDKDQNDIPDSDPEVRLSGFGIEDTHSVMNSLEWGPDGWLYGVNGSTTTGKVKCPATGKLIEWKGQMVWRYHPDTEHFEIYAEGGGNTFSLEIDSKGRVFSGTNNGNTRGMHYPQGSYGNKNWGKHGPLTNPYAFGYFQHMRHQGDRNRFAQAFCIYDGGLYPNAFKGKIIAPNSLHNVVWVSELKRDGSTFRTVDEANLIDSDDRWFRPVFSGVGPDGCVYLADWYDTRLSHVRPVDDWHKGSGRIYRVKPTGSAPAHRVGDLTKKKGTELLGLLEHPNRWVRRRAVLEIGWQNKRSLIPSLVKKVRANSGQVSLESLWALALLDGLEEKLAIEWLDHPDAHLRRWVVRLLGDKRKVSDKLDDTLDALANKEKDLETLIQLASSAKRFPAHHGLPILQTLAQRDESLADGRLPLMIWWGIETHSETGRALLRDWYRKGKTWAQPVFRETIAQRLMRRYAMAGGEKNLQSCADLLEAAPDQSAAKLLLTGLQLAFQGTSIPPLPERLAKQMDSLAAKAGKDKLLMEVLRGNEKAIKQAIVVVADQSADPIARLELAKAFGSINQSVVVGALLKNLGGSQQSALKRVSLLSLANYDDPRIPKTILSRYGATLPAEHGVRSTADRVLAGRLDWARQFLEKIDLAHIKAREVAPDVVQLLLQHKDPEINRKVAHHWPDLRSKSSKENQKEMARIKNLLSDTGKPGDHIKGKAIFNERCASCHKLFGEGGSVAPDLTGYERNNLDFWLPGIIDPSLEIREGYVNYVAKTKDSRILVGVIVEQNPQAVTLRDATNQSVTLARSGIESLKASPVSLMPPGLLNGLTKRQLRDLFAFLSK
jgi:putative membrane-bound dehydrogenase-like protein